MVTVLLNRHVHSVMGAFGLNASILDAANLAWKIGLCARGLAKTEILAPTYEMERRRHTVRIINISGSYLLFVCDSTLPVVNLQGVGTEPRQDEENKESKPDPWAGIEDGDLKFLIRFYAQNGAFLLGVDAPYGHSAINPPRSQKYKAHPPVVVKNGVRAPNPRVCFSTGKTGYLYDKMTGAAHFNLIVFASDLLGPVQKQLKAFSKAMAPGAFYHQFGGLDRFRVVVVAKCLPFKVSDRLQGKEMKQIREEAIIIFDDRAPDEDAHTCYGVDHAKGAVVVVRPDLWVGVSVFPDEVEELEQYFGSFLTVVNEGREVNGQTNGVMNLSL